MNVRKFSPDVDQNIRDLIGAMFNDQTEPKKYCDAMRELGKLLGKLIADRLPSDTSKHACVACTVEDADYLAQGFIESLESARPNLTVSFACFWNQPSIDPYEMEEFDVSRVIKSYKEPTDKDCFLIVLKSVISGGCVVATNIMNLITTLEPERIFVVAPMMMSNSPKRLREHFGTRLVRRFEYVTFATDTERQPGMSVYQHYGWHDADEKNESVPNLVETRRRRFASTGT